MTKILILSIFNETPEYNIMKNIQKQYVHSNDLIDYYFVTCDENINSEIKIIDDIIYVKSVDNYLNILEKTIIALDYLINSNNIYYDYIIRTNVSTIINYNLLINYLNNMPKENVYVGGVLFKLDWLDYKYGITTYKKNLYNLNEFIFFQGTGIIMSYDVVKNILNNKYNLKYDIVDDVAIGMFIRDYIPKAYMCMFNIERPKYSKNEYKNDCIIIRNNFYNSDRVSELKNMTLFLENILNENNN